MAISATLSLWGLYQIDPTVLDLLQLPTEVDADTVKNNLLLETEALEILYPDPGFLKQAIGAWSEKQLPVWQQLYDTTQYEYDPIANYDRTEHVEESSSGSSSGSDSSTAKKTAYNSNTFQDTGKTESEGQNQSEGSRTYDATVRGNIGVTTSQQMIEAQREVVKFNIVDYIINDFTKRFCVGVY